MNEREVALVAATKAGDSKAFEDLYNHYYGKIFALARMTVKNDANAEDILQDTFISAWKNMHSLADPAAFNTWLQKIALNQCYSLLRKKNITIQMDEESDIEDFTEEPSNELLPSIYAERDDLRVRLGKIIDGLSDIQKQTVVLYYFNEQKVEEIAYIMDCNVGTVKKRLFLARKAIRTEVEEEERRSGEKFYGIAGLPMLPIGSLLAQQFESQVLAAEIYTTALAAVTEAISGGGVTAGGGIAAEASVATAVEATAGASGGFMSSTTPGAALGASGVTTGSAATGISLGAKVMIGIAAAVVCVGIGIGGAYLVSDYITSDNELPEVEESVFIEKPTDDVTEKPVPTPEPTPEPRLDPTPEPTPSDLDSDAWKQFYIDVINEYREYEVFSQEFVSSTHTLLLINDDDIPEMINHGGTTAGGSLIISTATNNGIDTLELEVNSLLSYIERGNRFIVQSGRMGYYSDRIYEIQNGRFELLHEGHYGGYFGIPYNQHFDPRDAELYESFIWNDEEMTMGEYESMRFSAFDFSKATTLAGIGGSNNNHLIDGQFTPDELIKKIEDFER